MKVRAVIDTNVVVSGILSSSDSFPSRILDAWLRREGFYPLISFGLQKEIIEVLRRPKIQKRISDSDDLEVLLPILFSKAEMVKVKRIQTKAFSDKKDHFLFELALSGQAEVIVTGDGELLQKAKVQEVAIVSPREFCELNGL